MERRREGEMERRRDGENERRREGEKERRRDGEMERRREKKERKEKTFTILSSPNGEGNSILKPENKIMVGSAQEEPIQSDSLIMTTSSPSADYSASSYLPQIHAAMASLSFDLALKFILRALESDPDHEDILELGGVCCLDLSHESATFPSNSSEDPNQPSNNPSVPNPINIPSTSIPTPSRENLSLNDLTSESYSSQAIQSDKDAELDGSVSPSESYLNMAKAFYTRAIAAHPNQGYSKYLGLGQLSEGLTAKEYLEKGAALLEDHLIQLQTQDSSVSLLTMDLDPSISLPSASPCLSPSLTSPPSLPSTLSLLTSQLISALCSLVELHMTDLCDLPSAEEECERYLTQAMKWGDRPEVYIAWANVKLSQCQNEEAQTYILKALKFFYPRGYSSAPGCDVKESNLMEEQEEEEEEINYSPPCLGDVSFSSRVSLVKSLLEIKTLLPNSPLEYESCLDLLEGLLREFDEDPEIWYLFGWTYWVMGGGMVVESLLNREETPESEIQAVMERLMISASKKDLTDSGVPLNEIEEPIDQEERLELWEDSWDCMERVTQVSQHTTTLPPFFKMERE